MDLRGAALANGRHLSSRRNVLHVSVVSRGPKDLGVDGVTGGRSRLFSLTRTFPRPTPRSGRSLAMSSCCSRTRSQSCEPGTARCGRSSRGWLEGCRTPKAPGKGRDKEKGCGNQAVSGGVLTLSQAGMWGCRCSPFHPPTLAARV